MNTKVLAGGAIGAALAASICCLGPLALALLGLGGGAVLLKLEAYRAYFLVGTGALLGAAFYITYRRPPAEDCRPGTLCANPASRKWQKAALWIVTGVLLLAAFPYYAKYVL